MFVVIMFDCRFLFAKIQKNIFKYHFLISFHGQEQRKVEPFSTFPTIPEQKLRKNN